MKRFIVISLVLSFQILFSYCLLERIHPENVYFVSEDVDHHESHGHNEDNHHENDETCCQDFNLIYSGRTRVLLDKNPQYQYPRNDISCPTCIDIFTSFQKNLVTFDNHGPPEITRLTKFSLFVFFNHAPPCISLT